ncbi:metalloregulator ArsR/SmtB family transcription factor [Hyphomicrobiales bacterium]|uniref:ArsR/SmtB family transcription factor n=1 Tax=Rhizobium sp. PvP014 TaxID=2817851 RepID=UPI000DDD0BC3
MQHLCFCGSLCGAHRLNGKPLTKLPALEFEQAADLLSVMANGARLRVFNLIVAREWDVSSLAKEVGLSQSALSQHLKKMRDLKIVTARRDAQTIYYSCQSDAVAQVLTTLHTIFMPSKEHSKAA